MTDFILGNLRWLIVSAIVFALLVGGAIWGVNRWQDQPEYWLASAQKHYKEGETALEKKDDAAAKASLEKAEKLVKKVLDASTGPSGEIWLLRSRISAKLAQAVPGEADRHKENAKNYLSTAGSDRNCVEAQQLLLANLFREDNIQDLGSGKPFALNILTAKPEAHPNLKDLYQYQIGAHFILAWAEFYAQTPNPDQTLKHLEECRKLEQKYGPGAARDIRWREAGLEALARKAKAERDGKFTGIWRSIAYVLARKAKAERDGKGGRGEAAHAQLRKFRDQDIPAKLARVKETDPTKLSSTNLRGLLNFLLAAVELSTTPEQVAQRGEMIVQVCQKLTSGDKPSGRNSRETARAMNLLTTLLIREPVPGRLPPEQWLRLSDQMMALVSKARASGASVNLALYLGLARQADLYQRHDKAELFTRLGLEAASSGRRVTNKDLVPDLRTEAAWSLLLQNKLAEAQQHLSHIPRHKQSDRVHLIGGLVASLDGRLVDAVRELRLVRNHRTLLPYSAQANAYLGLGRYDLALEKLQEHHNRYHSSFPLTPTEERIANAFGLDPVTVDLEMLRCCLALGKAEAAAQLRESLRETPQRTRAELLAINSAIATGKALMAAQDYGPGRAILHQAGKELQAARKERPNDPELAWAEAQLLLSVPATTTKADGILRQFVSSSTVDPLSARIVWIAWLQQQGRTQDALNLLTEVEKTYAGSAEVLHNLRFVRAQLVLALDKSSVENARELVNAMHGRRNDIGTSIVEVLRLTGSTPEARSRQESQAQLLYLSGQLAQAEREFRQAIRFYERSLPFVAYRVKSEAGMLTSLLELSAAESPEQANRLAYELLQHNASEPSILLAFAETAIPLNRIYGRLDLKRGYDEQGNREMQGALQKLEDTLKKQGGRAVLGPYFKARAWRACGREDIALGEITRALKLNRVHRPSLLLAGELARAAGNGEDLLHYATELQQLPGKDEEKWEARYWHAMALHALGRLGEARRAYQELMVRYPDRHEGYLCMARLLEQQKKIGEALQVMARWRERQPEDARGLEEMVRLLSRDGKADQAEQLAQSLLQGRPPPQPPANGGRIVTARHVMAESNGSAENDVHGGNLHADGGVGRPAPSAEGANDPQLRNLELVVAVARGFGSAGVLDRAENWATRAVGLADSLPLPTYRSGRLQDCQLLLGDLYVQRIENHREGPERNQYVDKAISVYDAIHKSNPRQQTAAYHLASLLSKERQQHAAACAILEEALKSPTGENAYLVSGDRLPLDYLILVGETCMSGHCSESAAVLLDQATRHRYRDEPELFLFLGSCLARSGKQAEAAKKLHAAARLADQRATRVADDERQRWENIKAEAQRLLNELPKAAQGGKGSR